MTTKAPFSDIVAAAVRTHFDYTKDDILSRIEGSELFSEYEPDTPTEEVSGIAGAGYGVLTLEGQKYGANSLTREYPKKIRINKYTSELAWTEEDEHWIAKANEQKRLMRLDEIASNGLRPLVGNINKDLAKMFYLGAGTTFFTGGDAKALFATDHPIRKTGGTQDNYPSVAYQLTANAVDNYIQRMNRFKAQSGVQLRKVRRVRLVVPVELESTALQIRDSLYGPGNANLGLQKASATALSRRGIDFDVTVLPEVPDAYAAYWWLVDLDRAKDRLLLGWGWKPRMAHDTVVDNGTRKVDASTYFGPHAVGFQFAIGSPGTGAAI